MGGFWRLSLFLFAALAVWSWAEVAFGLGCLDGALGWSAAAVTALGKCERAA